MYYGRPVIAGEHSQSLTAERLVVLGAGAIARGLASVATGAGMPTVLCARSARSAASAHERLAAADGPPVAVTDSPECLRTATIAVEAVVEDLEAKREVLATASSYLPEASLMCTTTSSLALEPLSEASGRPDRFAALHVFNPVKRMALVEIAFLPTASAGTRARVETLCLAIGKTPVRVPPRAGFVVNRLLFPYLFAAVELLEDGLAPDDLDRCMTLGAGHPLGPLALLDLIGLDVSVAIGRELGIAVPARLLELVAAGHLGRKTGRGLLMHP